MIPALQDLVATTLGDARHLVKIAHGRGLAQGPLEIIERGSAWLGRRLGAGSCSCLGSGSLVPSCQCSWLGFIPESSLFRGHTHFCERHVRECHHFLDCQLLQRLCVGSVEPGEAAAEPGERRRHVSVGHSQACPLRSHGHPRISHGHPRIAPLPPQRRAVDASRGHAVEGRLDRDRGEADARRGLVRRCRDRRRHCAQCEQEQPNWLSWGHAVGHVCVSLEALG
mmetsp:Transcript_36836/g.90627  ORF Transcript_36836/g.90627 Transcript_36836/m.90627 type:complete len:225 (+) Transcript_36836:798-1472(+)